MLLFKGVQKYAKKYFVQTFFKNFLKYLLKHSTSREKNVCRCQKLFTNSCFLVVFLRMRVYRLVKLKTKTKKHFLFPFTFYVSFFT